MSFERSTRRRALLFTTERSNATSLRPSRGPLGYGHLTANQNVRVSMSENDVTCWVNRQADGDEEAVHAIWERCFERSPICFVPIPLMFLLGTLLRRVSDVPHWR